MFAPADEERFNQSEQEESSINLNNQETDNDAYTSPDNALHTADCLADVSESTNAREINYVRRSTRPRKVPERLGIETVTMDE